MNILKTWFLKQSTAVKVMLIILALGIIGSLLPKTEEEKQKEILEANTKAIKDSIDKLPYFLKPEKEKNQIIKDAFGGFHPPQWIQLCKAVKKEFKYPDETEVDSPKQYAVANIDSGFVWFSTEVHSKNGFGVKTTHTLKAQYRIDKEGKDFECYRYFVE